jgi:hypothetical protein
MNADGEAALIFGFNGIEVSMRPTGGSFEDPEWGGVRVDAEGVEGSSPNVAIDARGDVVAVWGQYTGPHPRLYAATRPAGGSFGAPVAVSPEGEEATEPAVAVDANGEATVVWLSPEGGGRVVQFATAPLSGAYSSPISLSGDAVNASSPQVTVDSRGDTVVFWMRGAYLNVATRYAGGSFPPPYYDGDGEVLGELASSSTPYVAIDEAGETLAAWKTPIDTVRTMRRHAGALAFGPGETLGSTTGLPSAAINEAGEAVAAWPSTHGVQVVTAAADPPYAPFGTPVELPSTFASNAAHVAISASGAVSVEWEVSNENGSSREGSSRPAGGSFVEPTGTFTTQTVTEGTLDVAADAAGDLLGVWNTGPPLRDMNSMLYDSGPQLTDLSTSNNAVVGQTLPFTIGISTSVWRPVKSITWNFGDGSTASGLSVTHAYTQPGTYTVTVTATDSQFTGRPCLPSLCPEYVGNSLSRIVTVTSPTTTPAPAPLSVRRVQSLTDLSIKPTSFVASTTGPSATTTGALRRPEAGATVHFALSLSGRTTFGVELSTTGTRDGKKCLPAKSGAKTKHATKCALLRRLGSFQRDGSAGNNSFYFTGRLGGKTLAAESYIFTASADGAHESQRVPFKILRR